MTTVSSRPSLAGRVAILYPSDPAGSVPSGIDSFIRGILKWAPPDLEYLLVGASSDEAVRPLGVTSDVELGRGSAKFLPVASVSPTGSRSRVPLTVRYLSGLRRILSEGRLDSFDIVDCHRIEPLLLLGSDRRPRNVVLHQDMSVLRNKNSDILWRHAPWLYEWLERRLFAGVDRVFCVRESAVDRYRAMYPANSERFQFIPTWVDTAVFRPLPGASGRRGAGDGVRAQLGLSSAARVLVFVGRLDRQKDPLLLLKSYKLALREHSDLHLIMIGDGVMRPQVEAECRDPSLHGKVTLLGVRPPAEIAAVLQVSDLFVMSSAYEGMPIAVLEALATGVPVVSTDVGEVGRVVRDAFNGFIARDRTPVEFAAALDAALEALPVISGKNCVDSVAPYGPEQVLSILYENHRRQLRKRFS